MKLFGIIVLLGAGLWQFSISPVRAHVSPPWYVTSPNHGQTFAYGSKWQQQWSSRGHPNHLFLYLVYTNDPYVDNVTPREYDDFSFDFPEVKLQPDGRTYSYRAPDGRLIAVARREAGFLGIEEIKLLPTSDLLIDKPHGFLTLTLRITASGA